MGRSYEGQQQSPKPGRWKWMNELKQQWDHKLAFYYYSWERSTTVERPSLRGPGSAGPMCADWWERLWVLTPHCDDCHALNKEQWSSGPCWEAGISDEPSLKAFLYPQPQSMAQKQNRKCCCDRLCVIWCLLTLLWVTLKPLCFMHSVPLIRPSCLVGILTSLQILRSDSGLQKEKESKQKTKDAEGGLHYSSLWMNIESNSLR